MIIFEFFCWGWWFLWLGWGRGSRLGGLFFEGGRLVRGSDREGFWFVWFNFGGVWLLFDRLQVLCFFFLGILGIFVLLVGLVIYFLIRLMEWRIQDFFYVME